MQTRRRSSSAPPLQPLPSFSLSPVLRPAEHTYGEDSRMADSSGPSHVPPRAGHHQHSHSGSSVRGLRSPLHRSRDPPHYGVQPDHNPSVHALTRASSSSSFWTQQHSPAESSPFTERSPVSPVSSSYPWSPPTGSVPPPASAPFIGISVDSVKSHLEDYAESEVSSLSSSGSSEFNSPNTLPGTAARTPPIPSYRPASPMQISPAESATRTSGMADSPLSAVSDMRKERESTQRRAPIRPW